MFVIEPHQHVTFWPQQTDRQRRMVAAIGELPGETKPFDFGSTHCTMLEMDNRVINCTGISDSSSSSSSSSSSRPTNSSLQYTTKSWSWATAEIARVVPYKPPVLPKSRVYGLHFVADSMDLASVDLTHLLPKSGILCEVTFKVTQGHRFWYRSKARKQSHRDKREETTRDTQAR